MTTLRDPEPPRRAPNSAVQLAKGSLLAAILRDIAIVVGVVAYIIDTA